MSKEQALPDYPDQPLPGSADYEQEIDFIEDKLGHMTWGRRIALFLSERSSWYNPHLGKVGEIDEEGREIPSLAKAWAYFEHVTLLRYVVDDGYRAASQQQLTFRDRFLRIFYRGDRQLHKAEPGEKRHFTKLYNPLTTPLSQLGDFGLGYGLYFSTLRAFGILCFFAGLANIPNLIYFSSDDYSLGQEGLSSVLLKGSAICTDQPWVACPTCPKQYTYQRGSFSKWKESFSLYIEPDDQGGWTNVTKYLNWDGDGNVHDWYYFDSRLIFDEDVLVKLNEELGVTIDEFDQVIQVAGYGNVTCDGPGLCLENNCWCQYFSDTDCYCDFGQTEFADTKVDVYGFAQLHNCNGATLETGFFNMLSVFIFIVGALGIRARQNKLVVKFDEDEQTAQDYSICILNPPPDAHDPTEWKAFFEENFDCHVTVCTIDVDNDGLVKNLSRRRELLQAFELALPGIELTEEHLKLEAGISKDQEGWLNTLGILTSLSKLYEEYQNLNEAISVEVKENRVRDASTVFITFETETGQREVLKWLTVGSMNAANNNKDSVGDPRHLFRGEYVLNVIEPEEPSTIRWQEMHVTTARILIGIVITSFISLVFVVIAFFVITFLYTFLVWAAPIVTTIFTSIFPLIAKSLMNFERHRSETSREKWLFIKIASFNILVTSVLLSVVNPFTATLDDREDSLTGLIPAVHALFFSQLILTPAMQLSDYMGHINRHLIGPRAKTQIEMNRLFTGSRILLSERYANLMKYLFLVVWYCSIYPAGFFMGSVALIIVYFVDRFSLMRTWSRAPQLGTQISDFARNYFTPSAIALMAVFSAYAWSGFPYDNLCIDEDAEVNLDYTGEWFLEIPGSEKTFFGASVFKAPDINTTFTINPGDPVYKFCLQDFRAYLGDPSFPPLPSLQLDPWMTEDQETLLEVYSWVAVFILAVVILSFVVRIGMNIRRAYVGSYEPRGDDMKIPFSSIKSIDTYIPFLQPTHGYPFLLCDVSEIDPSLFSWTDPDKVHEEYDVTKDIQQLARDTDISKSHFFAKVKHWPAPVKEKRRRK